MTWLIYIGASLFKLIVPILYVFLLVALWARIRHRLLRISCVAVLALLGIGVFAQVVWRSYGGAESYEIFLAHCDDYSSGEVVGSPARSSDLLADFDWISRTPDDANRIGYVVLPIGLVRRLGLNGARPYQGLTARAGNGFDKWSRGSDGRLDTQRRLQTSDTRYAYSWRPNSLSSHDAVASATLTIVDRESGDVLGTHPVFAWKGPSADSMPYPTWVPGTVRARTVETCPQPIVLVDFIKSVVQPSLEEDGRD